MSRVIKFGDAVSTDTIIPGRYNITTDLEELGRAAFIEARPDYAGLVQPGDVLVAGRNFGCGSSREHAPLAIKASGISAVVARTFARIFYRNAVNIGLPVLVCDELHGAVGEGDEIEVDIASGAIRAGGRTFQAERPSGVALKIIEAGSLTELVRTRGWAAVEGA